MRAVTHCSDCHTALSLKIETAMREQHCRIATKLNERAGRRRLHSESDLSEGY